MSEQLPTRDTRPLTPRPSGTAPSARGLWMPTRRSRLIAVAVLTVLAVLGPFPATPAGAAPPAGDDFADAVDLSASAVPDFPATTTVNLDLTGTTWEADELVGYPGPPGGQPTPPGPADTGSLWLRYTSTGFTGLLGYRTTPGVMVGPFISGSADPYNPGFPAPSEQPAQLATRYLAPSYYTQVPGTPDFSQPLLSVRVEPGDTIYFQVYRERESAPTDVTFELFRAPLLDDTVDEGNIYEPVFTTPSMFIDRGLSFGGSLHQSTPDDGNGPGDIWRTFTTTGAVNLNIGSESQWKPSTRPFTARLYRAPTYATVTSVAELGAPVFSSTGSLKERILMVDGVFRRFDQYRVDQNAIPLAPGRYYLQLEADSQGGTFILGTLSGLGPNPADPPTNLAPTARPDTLTVPSGGNGNVDLLVNDSDPDNDPLTVSSVTRTATGTAPGSLNCTGRSCTYTANAGASGSDTFSYSISDGRGGTATSTLTITVTPPPLSMDQVSVRLTGARSYAGDGLVSGNVSVTRAFGQLTGVSGAGTVATTPGGPLATVVFDVRRVLLFDLWFGSVTVTNPSTGLSVTTPVNSAPSVARDGTVSGNTNWFTTGTFPNLIQNYRLSWSVLDRS